MLKPAVLYKDQLEKLFAAQLYTENYFMYEGYPYLNELPNLQPAENLFRFAIVDDNDDTHVIGYFAYRIEGINDSCTSFGIYSFDPGNITNGRDIFNKMEELVAQHHRVEWRMISTNPVKRSYDKFCQKHNGNIVCLHDVTKDLEGNYVDEYIYEIINPNR